MSKETDDMAMWYQQLADARRNERERIITLVEAELSCTCGTPFSHLLDKIKETA